MRAPCLVIAVGNLSRGDDALAPLLLQYLRGWLEESALQGGIELLEDFQLQVEHAADIHERKMVLFADAGMETPSPYTVERIWPKRQRAVLSHALEPEGVLDTYVQVYGQHPPPSYVLCISGAEFDLGADLSLQAVRNLEAASAFATQLLREGDPEIWERMIGGGRF